MLCHLRICQNRYPSVRRSASTSYPSASDESLTVQETSQSSAQHILSSEKEKSSSEDSIRARVRANLKRTIESSSSGPDTSRSSDSSAKRKRVQFIQSMHSYAVSPGRYKRKFEALRKTQMKSRKRLYTAKKTITNLKRKITTLKTIVEDLRNSQHLSEGALHHLQKCYEDVPHLLMRRYLKNAQNSSVTRERFSDRLWEFAA